MKKNVLLITDSIISCNTLNKKQRCVNLLKREIKKYKFRNISKVGGTSSFVVKNFLKKIRGKKFEISILQIGLNDSYHFKSLKGKPQISKKVFKKNLINIILELKKVTLKKILVLNYHKLLKNSLEINGKTINENLNIYNKIIEKISKKIRAVSFLNIAKLTSKILPKKICRPFPDGVHLSAKGAKIYSKILNRYLTNI